MSPDEIAGFRLNRRWLSPIAFSICLVLSTTSAALAAPTCIDRHGDPIRCGAVGAMPVGWSRSTAQFRQEEVQRLTDSGWTNLAKAFCIVGVLLVGIALLPEFDGADDASWDKQERDDKNQR